jgi:hypothetical protein
VSSADPSAEIVLRLTPTQYRASLEDLLLRAYSRTQMEAFLGSPTVAALFTQLPADGAAHHQELTYDTNDQRISPLLVGPQLDIATAIAAWIADDPARLGAFTRTYGGATACATPAAAGCVDAVIQGFGLRALRHPPTAEEISALQGQFQATTYGGWRGLIAGALLSPGFVFRTEFEGQAVGGRTDLTRLTPYEVAARLSYSLTDSAPDDALLTAAAANFTGQGNTLAEQATRLMGSPRARARFAQFYRQWLRPDRIPLMNPSVSSVLSLAYPDNSASPLAMTTDLPAFRQAAIDEQLALLLHYTLDQPGGSMRDVLLTDASFTSSADLARAYGVPTWNGSAGQMPRFPAGQRAGLFTRAGYLLSGYPDPNPVMRGARLRVEYLCDQLTPPADTSPPAQYMRPAVPTVRNDVIARTQIAGTACNGCHSTAINPLGFSFEHYDGLGRYRTQEPLLNLSGGISSWVPVNASTAPNIPGDDDSAQVRSGVELSSLLAQSPKFHGCFARHAFRQTLGRHENVTADGCALRSMEEASRGQSIQAMYLSLIASPAFSLRKLPGGN